MPLSPEQVLEIQKTQSHYGCGNDDCVACYPIQYACADCYTRFTSPIAKGEHYECESCGFNSKENN